MSSYSGNSRPRDRAKAIGAVIVIHVVLASVILAGLNVARVADVVDRLQTVDIREVLSPPRQRTPEPPKARAPAGRAAPRTQPSAVVAPPRKVPAPAVLPAASLAGEGSASSAGAAGLGDGTGAGGSGNGAGAGGSGAGFTPAQLVRNIPSTQYGRLASTGMASGQVGVTLLVGSDGRPGNCRIARSSDDARVDALVCQLTLRFVRFRPARDPQGRPVAQDITYFPTWRRR